MTVVRLLTLVLGSDRAKRAVTAYAITAARLLHQLFLALFRIELAVMRALRRPVDASPRIIDRHMRVFVLVTPLFLPVLE